MTVFTHVPTAKEIPNISVTYKNGCHLYETPDGSFVGITSKLARLPRFILPIQAWEDRIGIEKAKLISQQAISRGKDVHALCEAYLSNNALPDVSLLGTAMFEKMKPELDKINFIQCLETPIWSKELGTAGQCDIIGLYQNSLSVIDAKTSLKPKKMEYLEKYWLQTTAYSCMFQYLTGVKIEQLVLIIGDETGTVNTYVQSRSKYIDQLKECLAEYQQITYPGVVN